jgi:hypothetical protein
MTQKDHVVICNSSERVKMFGWGSFNLLLPQIRPQNRQTWSTACIIPKNLPKKIIPKNLPKKKNEVAKNFSSFNHIPAVPPHLPHPQPAPFRRGTAAPSTSASTPLWVALAPSVAMRVTEEEALSNCGCHGWDFPWDFPWEFPGEFPWEFPGEFHGK